MNDMICSVSIVLGIGIFRGLSKHLKTGHGAALSAIGGAILIAVILKNVVGLTNWGDAKFHQLPSVGGAVSSLGRGW
jgi:hypothetical protein